MGTMSTDKVRTRAQRAVRANSGASPPPLPSLLLSLFPCFVRVKGGSNREGRERETEFRMEIKPEQNTPPGISNCLLSIENEEPAQLPSLQLFETCRNFSALNSPTKSSFQSKNLSKIKIKMKRNSTSENSEEKMASLATVEEEETGQRLESPILEKETSDNFKSDDGSQSDQNPESASLIEIGRKLREISLIFEKQVSAQKKNSSSVPTSNNATSWTSALKVRNQIEVISCNLIKLPTVS